MLDPWIIEEILRREEESRRQEERGRVIPLEPPRYRDQVPEKSNRDDEDSSRGVIVIDI